MTLKKKIKYLILSLIVLSFVLVATYLVIVNLLKISYNAALMGPVDKTVQITRTSHGLPTINTENVEDMYFSLGYCHAKDRLNFMEYQRAIAIGVADRIIKGDAVILNNISRTIGFTRKAMELKKKLPADQLNLLQKYCNGINFIRKNEKYTGTLKRDWFPEDVLSILVMKEWSNSYLNNIELVLQANIDKTSDRIKKMLKSKYLYFYKNEDTDMVMILRNLKSIIYDNIGYFHNGFSIGINKKYTKNLSAPITAFNYDSQTCLYPDIYPVKIKLNGRLYTSITMAGLPFLFSFKTENYSMFSSNLKCNSQKFYLLRTSIEDNIPHYLTRGGLKEFTPVRIPDFSDKTELSFNLNWETDLGPIINNIYENSLLNDKIISIQSIYPDLEYIDLLFKAPFEQSLNRLQNSIRKIQCSAKTFTIQKNDRLYSAISGSYFSANSIQNIFHTTPAPVRPGRIWRFRQNSNIIISGSDIIPPEGLNSEISKVIINNKYRMSSMESMLKSRRIYDIDYLKEILTNSDSYFAKNFITHFIRTLETNPSTSARLARIYYTNWNFQIEKKSIAPTIFYSSFYYGIIETLKDDMGDDASFNFKNIHLLTEPFLKIAKGGNIEIFDNKNTDPLETREATFDKAFLFAIRELSRRLGPKMENWHWGNIYKSHFRIPNLDKSILFSFIRKDKLPVSGNFDTIYNSTGDYKLTPMIIPSLYGIFDSSRFYLRFNFGYSTSLFSDFFYWKKSTKTIKDINTEEQTTQTTINPVK